MSTALRPLAVLLVAVAAVASLPGSAPAEASTDSFMTKVNKARAAHGLPKLKSSTSLRGSSRGYARRMLRRGHFGHGARIQTSRRFALRGEVLARTHLRHPSAAEIVTAWLDSPTHRAVLLNPRYRYIGVGRAQGRLGGRPATLLVGHFGAR